MGRNTKKNKKTKVHEDFELEQDEYFYYIAGYTSGGAPYGITWEEAYKEGLTKPKEVTEDVFL